MMLETVGLGRRPDDRWLLANVNLSVDAGQRLALVGPSGSGKTLLLRALAMLDPIDAGEIRWNDSLVPANEVPLYRSQIMYLPQRPALLEGTVEDNLRLPFSLGSHRQKSFDPGRITELLEQLGRERSFLAKQHSDLSGGESQIVALIRAIQLDPQVLLLDEPTAALDFDSTSRVERVVAGWLDEQTENRALIWVAHDRTQTARVANLAYRIERGRLEAET